MKNVRYIFMAILGGLLFVAGCSGESGDSDKTEITYWQYTFPTKVDEIDKIIEDFEEENPDIKVTAQDFPHDQFQNKIFAAMKADEGPDIMNIYDGWMAEFVDRGYIQPIRDEFMTDEEIEDYYVDMVKPNKTDDKHYTLPIAVRTLALFYNKDMFEEAGLDPDDPPETWDELIEYAEEMTEVDSDGKYEQEGFGWNVGGQGLHNFQQVLLRQFGVDPYSEDGEEVLWNSEQAGYDAFEYWIDMTKKDQIGDKDFGNSYREAFVSGLAGMIVDGSFAIGDIEGGADFDWGVTKLPVLEEGGEESNYASYWTNAIADGVEGDELEASEKFLEYLIQEDVQREWLENVGEMPAAQTLVEDEDYQNDDIYGPFIEGLEHAHATFFVNAEKERDIMMETIDEILLEDAPYDETFDKLVDKIQEVRDEYFDEQ